MFGFLKNKIKEWVDTAKDKLKSEEKLPEEEKEKEIDVSKTSEKKEKKAKKEKKKEGKKTRKEEVVVETEKELEEKIEKIESKEILAEDSDVKKVIEEQKKIKDVEGKLEKGEISAHEAVEEIQEISEGAEEELLQTEKEKKGFFKKLFGKKEGKSAETEEIEILAGEEPEKEKSFFQKVKSTFVYKITEEDFISLFEDLEMLLLENNVALEAVEDVKKHLSEKLIGKEISKNELEEEIRKELKKSLEEILIDPENPVDLIKIKKSESEEPFVILFFGINGTGKTTSIAKMAHLLKEKGFSVVIAAADTFRAASIEQISEHANRLGIHLIKHDYNADPAAVGFDAVKYAQNHKIDAVLIDTAGRMHTKSNLISEMEKISRVTKPDLKVFVAESIAGNDATEQARTFNEAIGIDGTILSKADVDEKGGTIISISYITHKPIIYLGTGQEYKDLKLFDKEDFIKSLGL